MLGLFSSISCEELEFLAPLKGTMTADEWNALMLVVDQNLTAPEEFIRRCDNCGPDSSMTVELAAVTDDYRVGGDSTPAYGAVVARVVSLSSSQGTENLYGMPDGNFAFLLVVKPPTSSAEYGEWTLVQFSWTPQPGGLRSYTYQADLVSGIFNPCDHPSKRTAKASFADCDNSSSLHKGDVGRAHLAIAPTNRTAIDPLWVRCVAGCCTAQRR
jgi:hypothetical protein